MQDKPSCLIERKWKMYGKDQRWYHVRKHSCGRQIETFLFLKHFIEERGYSPTVQEIADEIRVSKSTAHRYLKRLEAVGLIRWESVKPRTIRLNELPFELEDSRTDE